MSVRAEDVVMVTVVRDFDRYDRLIAKNPFVAGIEKQIFDNNKENLPIPARYNQFLNNWDFSRAAWFVFLHEDFEIQEPLLEKLQALSPAAIYGPVGSRRFGLGGIGWQQVLGGITERNRNDTGRVWMPGRAVKTGTRVETVDCCALIVHSSLVQRLNLRFDETLEFDLYAEDFCAQAWVADAVPTRIVALRACHHSGSPVTSRLYRHLEYLRRKYPQRCFSGTCVYFGMPPLLMRLENHLLFRPPF